MDCIEKSAKTVEEAIEAALNELKITADEADITVLDQGKPGVFLGLGARNALVRVAKKVAQKPQVETVEAPKAEAVESAPMAEIQEEAAPEPQEAAVIAKEAEEEKKPRVIDEAAVAKAKEFLQQVFEAMKIEVVMEKFVNTQDGSVTFGIHGGDLGILIGKHGQTLDALQYLTNLAANKVAKDRTRIIVDVEDYRDRRLETLTRLARRLADKVRKDGDPIALEPMNPHERKIVHMALQGDRKVTTISEGEDPRRYVVIKLKN